MTDDSNVSWSSLSDDARIVVGVALWAAPPPRPSFWRHPIRWARWNGDDILLSYWSGNTFTESGDAPGIDLGDGSTFTITLLDGEGRPL